MLKLTMSANLLNAVASSMATVALNVREISKTHKGLKAQEEKSIIKNAEVLDIPVEQYRADKAKQALKQAEEFATKLPFFSNIKEKATKVATLTKTDDEVIISINEEYLTECIQAAERVTLKLLKPLADAACIFGDEEEASEAFEAKWFPKDENEEDPTDPIVEINHVDTNDVSVEIRSSVEYFNWTIIPSEFSNPEPFFTDEENENFFSIHYLNGIHKDGREISASQIKVAHVLKSTDTLLNTARKEALPVSFVKAIRAFYGQSPLVDATQN